MPSLNSSFSAAQKSCEIESYRLAPTCTAGVSTVLPSCTYERRISTSLPPSVPSSVMNWVVTVIGFVVSSMNDAPGPKKVVLPRRYGWMSQPFLSQTPLKRSPPLSPHCTPSQRVCSVTEHACAVYAVEMLFDSQMSISAQHVPYLPTPALGSVALGFHPSTLGSPLINLRSCGHCASQ